GAAAGVRVRGRTPAVTSSAESVSGYPPVVTPAITTAVVPGTGFAPASGSDGDGLDEVNALRAARGLRPFVRDEGLTQAARSCAQFRAANGLFGHTSNDFAFVPAGTSASSAGCAAYPASYGWLRCCVYDNYTYGGAAWVTGHDGRRYMHLFVRGSGVGEGGGEKASHTRALARGGGPSLSVYPTGGAPPPPPPPAATPPRPPR